MALESLHTLLVIWPLLILYLFTKLRYKRLKEYSHLPQPPKSLLLGHLGFVNKVIKEGKEDRHIDMVLSEIHKKMDRPPLFFLDFRPISYPVAVICNHNVAEQLTRPSSLFPYGTPRAKTFTMLERLLGPNSIIFKTGDEWKELRKHFNAAFAPQHLATMIPNVVAKTDTFLAHLNRLAHTGDDFSLSRLLVLLTFDIIGAVILDEDLGAQHLDDVSKHGTTTSNDNSRFSRLFLDLIATYHTANEEQPRWMTPLADLKRRIMAKQVNTHLSCIVRRRYAEMELQRQSETPCEDKFRSVLSLSLLYHKSPLLSAAAEHEACDQIKTFLFAGHDTTSVFLVWMVYELWRTPRALAAVRAELDAVFGVKNLDIREQLCSVRGHEMLGRLTYIGAVIKETLRLHPPAGAPRIAEKGSGLKVYTPTGDEYVVDGAVLYINHYIIHRDVTVYGPDADLFMPERWLGREGKAAGSEVPASAWRPFERGSMDCIGQGLAILEARVLIAMVARQFDFVKVGLGEFLLNENGKPEELGSGQYKPRSELYNIRLVLPKPADGMKMKVKLTNA